MSRGERRRHTRSRSRRRDETEHADAWMVEDRLQELDASGHLPVGSLDESAESMLRKCDPQVALDALADWERHALSNRRNPSACMVSLLRRMGAGGDGNSGRGSRRTRNDNDDEDDDTSSELQDLLDQLGNKIDDSATSALRSLSTSRAVHILTGLVNQGEAVRNPSAFVMSAVRRWQGEGDQGGRHSRREEGRGGGGGGGRREGGGGHHDSSIYDGRGNLEPGAKARYDERGYPIEDTEDTGGASNNNRGSSKRKSGSDVHKRIENLHAGLDVDRRARDALDSLEPEEQVNILEDLVRTHATVRNQSAYVLSKVKRAQEDVRSSEKSHRREEEHSRRDYDRDRDRGNRDRQPVYERETRSSRQARSSDIWDKLDDKARGELEMLNQHDLDDILRELEAKRDTIRNPSAFVCSVVRRYRPESGHQKGGREDYRRGQEDFRGGYDYRDDRDHRSRNDAHRDRDAPRGRNEPRLRSRSPHHDSSRRDSEQKPTLAGRDDMDDESGRQQVADFVENCDLLDEKAKRALCNLRPNQALEIMQMIASKGPSIRNHSAFVMTACRDAGGQREREGEPRHHRNDENYDSRRGSDGRERQGDEDRGGRRKQATSDSYEGSVDAKKGDAQEQPAGFQLAEEYRDIDLHDWLSSVDNGKGFLAPYQEALLANFDTLEQIIELYVSADSGGRVVIDQMFYNDIGVEKVGHKRLFEKWFKDRML
eukprot:TRINITY_DN5391_c0_g1_i1.p1 TRINITY_DN5391_c0_g1~~TRINITY_DN5391_c0_g1_i1.p1  ORF type:complete len:712 (+),score=97.55 TRINITY_DN5391_c0_g1_i1:170-2305(+)